jgi:Transposase DNA-binding
MGKAAAFTFEDAVAEMGRAQLGYQRRTARRADSARRISQNPGGSLPEKLKDPAAYRATLRLMNNPQVTHQKVLQPHIQATLERMRHTTATVVIAEDLVELDYSNQRTLAAMGQIGNGAGRGYECHNSLAIDTRTGELLGLVSQILHHRVRKPAREGVANSRERDNRESLLWVKAVQQIGPAPDGCHWVDVGDRAADTFEFLEYEARNGRHFVVRSTHSRALEVESDEQPHLLHGLLRSLPAQLGWEVEVSANQGQPQRKAQVLCCWTAVTIKAPHVRKGRHGREPLAVWAIRVWEADAPPGVNEPLEWILLTDEPIGGGGEARQRVGYYERRPRVEDYPKAQKTGLGVEQSQLQSQAGLQPMIALLSVLAVALVNAREAARTDEKADRPATDFFAPLMVTVLCVWRYKEARPLTVREYILALGRLGGHLNRKCDGLPGWLTLWRGAMKLNARVEYEQARRSNDDADIGRFSPPLRPKLSSPSIGQL